MPVNPAQLRTEIDTDPNGYGLVALRNAGDAQGIADALNLPRAAITARRANITRDEVLEAIDVRDFAATPNQVVNAAGAVAWFESVTQADRLRLLTDAGTNTRVLANLNRLLGDTNGSQTRLTAVANKNPASRAEQLFGVGTVLQHGDVSQALSLP